MEVEGGRYLRLVDTYGCGRLVLWLQPSLPSPSLLSEGRLTL